jgi:hypothetical protein
VQRVRDGICPAVIFLALVITLVLNAAAVLLV